MSKKNKPRTMLELVKTIRGSWGGLNPVTRVNAKPKGYKRSDNPKDFEEE